MNEVDTLLIRPFHRLSDGEKDQVKTLGPHQPKDFVLSQVCGRATRHFNQEWFSKFEWLTVGLSEVKKKLFCFYCLLFYPGHENAWAKNGFCDLSHFTVKAKSHEESSVHLTCALKYRTFGTTNIASKL